jgi:hypothetical protein
MTCINSGFRLVLPLALLLGGAAAPVLAQGTGQPRTDGEAAMRVYRSGDKFVVAIYRQDGSASLALVEPPQSPASGKAAPTPAMADLMKSGRVIYAVKVAATDRSAETIDGKELAGKLGTGTSFAELTPKQRSDLIKQHKSVADMLDMIGKGLADGTEVGAATLDAKRAP